MTRPIPPRDPGHTFRRYVRETWQQLAGMVGLAAVLAYVGAAASVACTPGERATAGSLVSTLAPALCATLAALTGADGATVGLVCADVSKGLGAALTLASASTLAPTMARVSAKPATCTPIMLAAIVPGRDPREYVCRESGLDENAIRRALDVGHAR